MKLSRQYMAGFFDGEGCVNMARTRASVFPRVLITNTNREILEQFQRQYGGDINSIPHRRKNWKPGWFWRLQWAGAIKFLEDILPWLVVKEAQALTAIAWQAAAPKPGQRWDVESLALLTERMKWLNQKGPAMGKEDPILPVLRELRSGQAEMSV
jgi:hypothetical protein